MNSATAGNTVVAAVGTKLGVEFTYADKAYRARKGAATVTVTRMAAGSTAVVFEVGGVASGSEEQNLRSDIRAALKAAGFSPCDLGHKVSVNWMHRAG